MAFTSFTKPWRTSEADEKTLSSFAPASSFISLASKFRRSRRSSEDDSARSDCHSDTDGETVFSSTDAGDDFETTFVDFDDFESSTSEEDIAEDQILDPPCIAESAPDTCIYSVKMLLRLRAGLEEKDDDSEVHYGTRPVSELPAHFAAKAKASTKTRAPQTSTTILPLGPADTAGSWRQALPESTAESWIAQQRKRAAEETQDDDDAVTRAARSILNKLTVEKFDPLFEQLATCGINRSHQVSILMREVFEKATTQHHFIPMYAELCVKLEKDPRIAAVVEKADLPNNFRRLLLNECQNVFEQLLELRNGEDSADEEAAFRRKQQALGNMKLIGQLLVLGMLSSDLFPECCEEMLRKRTQCPEALESLVALMMVAGPKFDSRSWQYFHRLEMILANMNALTKDKSVPPRLRFLIRDVLDARDAGWPSSKGNGKTPTTLEQVRNATTAPCQQKEESTEECSGHAAYKSNSGGHAKTQGKGNDDTKIAVKAGKKKSVKFCQKEAMQEVIASAAAAPSPKEAFSVVDFRRSLGSIFADLASDKNIPGAVQRVRMQQVPVEVQAEQFMDLLTRVVEERRGAVRRCELAFLAGLVAAEDSAFDRKECLAGIGRFFSEVYADLCNEVHRLPAIMKSEFLPTVSNVFSTADLNKVVPSSMRK